MSLTAAVLCLFFRRLLTKGDVGDTGDMGDEGGSFSLLLESIIMNLGGIDFLVLILPPQSVLYLKPLTFQYRGLGFGV